MIRNCIQVYLELMGCVVLAGCTAGPVEGVVPENARMIALSFGKPDLGMPVVLTRAGEAGAPSPELLPEGATLRIGAYFRSDPGEEQAAPVSFSTTAPTLEATYKVEADGSLSSCRVDDNGKPVDGEAKEMVVRGGVYDFFAVSPARKWVKDTDDDVYKIKDIPHKEDVMTSSVRGVTVSSNSRRVALGTFNRKCALVVFNVAPSKENVLPFDRLYATRLVISKISSSGAVLIVGADTGIQLIGGNGGYTAQVVFGTDEFEPVEADPDNVGLNKAKGVLLPKSEAPFDVEIDVQRDDKTATLKATIDKSISFDGGKRYVFTLEVKNNESRLLLRVLDWHTISFTDTHVGAPDRPYPDPDINEGIGTTFTVARWKEITWTGNGEAGSWK
ncbi:fimbrillin family protein [Parabacteroides faecis]|uniref:fimbrillin family protein n=1 Tax=Parabacteroides faecis TaxID=1217282 RepID=UPI002164999C|nr:fimbrillin family protein [Parabacteroides faecis]MCS2893877.1 fimbrillin family protein [Parabacteroides faecis]UVQ47539.1 fimbrillin family protein [Parabacteroides faecis]